MSLSEELHAFLAADLALDAPTISMPLRKILTKLAGEVERLEARVPTAPVEGGKLTAAIAYQRLTSAMGEKFDAYLANDDYEKALEIAEALNRIEARGAGTVDIPEGEPRRPAPAPVTLRPPSDDAGFEDFDPADGMN